MPHGSKPVRLPTQLVTAPATRRVLATATRVTGKGHAGIKGDAVYRLYAAIACEVAYAPYAAAAHQGAAVNGHGITAHCASCRVLIGCHH